MLVRLELLISLYVVLVVLDVGLGWVTPDPRRWPRRLTHWLTEPPQALVRRCIFWIPTGGWDLSPLLVVVMLGAARVWLLQP